MGSALKESKGKEQHGQGTDAVRTAQSAPTVESRGLAPSRRGGLTSLSGFEPFDRMFEQFFRGWPSPFFGAPNAQWHWGMEMQENDNEIVVRAEAPGFDPADFDVQITGDSLQLRASHQTESEGKDRGIHEWSRQEFSRVVPLPAGTDPNKVEAHYRNGVLVVKLPRSEDAKGRRIAVQG